MVCVEFHKKYFSRIIHNFLQHHRYCWRVHTSNIGILRTIDTRRKALWLLSTGFGNCSHCCSIHELLNNVYCDDRIIIIWPPRSPDLSPCDFFLWGYLKDQVYAENLLSEEELRRSSEEKIAAIPRDLLQRANQNVFRRCQECIRVEGHHFQHLFKVR